MQKKFLGILIVIVSFTWIMPLYAKDEGYPYYITVNLTQNIVTVYNTDEAGNYTVAERAFYCSVGEETPIGTFRTSDKYVWRPLFGDVYGQYATRITGHILFHSVPYLQQDKGTLEYEEYNKLGETASMGCIRLTVEDVKWIYDNCPSGTTVKIYKSDEQEPIAPPKPQKIDLDDPRRDWDPTDPDEANPWTKGEVVALNMVSNKANRKINAYYRDGSYALQAEDAQLILGHLGITLVLPHNNEALQQEGQAEVFFQGKKYQVPYIKHEGKAFFSLRELGEITEAEIIWDESIGQIILEYYGAWGKNLFRLFSWKDDSNALTKTVAFATE